MYNIQSRLDCGHRGVCFDDHVVSLDVKTQVKSAVNLSSNILSYLYFFGSSVKIYKSKKNMQMWGVRSGDVVGLSCDPDLDSIVNEVGPGISVFEESGSPYRFDFMSNLDSDEDLKVWGKVHTHAIFRVSFSNELVMSSVQFPTMIIPWKNL